MSTYLTSSYPLDATRAMPGSTRFWIANFEGVTGITTNATQQITGITLSSATYFYEFHTNKNAINYSNVANVNPTNGTTSWTTTITIYLSKYQTSLRNQINLLAAKNNVMLITQDKQGQTWLSGYDPLSWPATYGMNCTGVAGALGQDYSSDTNGFTITFSFDSTVPDYEVVGLSALNITQS